MIENIAIKLQKKLIVKRSKFQFLFYGIIYSTNHIKLSNSKPYLTLNIC